jgi:hypothetical protein
VLAANTSRKNGQIVYGGFDHYARLAAKKHLRDFMAAGRFSAEAPGDQDRKLTPQEIPELVEASALKEALNVAPSGIHRRRGEWQKRGCRSSSKVRPEFGDATRQQLPMPCSNPLE